MSTEYWAKPVIDRDQMPMFSPTLSDMISEDHPVRLFEEVSRQVDWSLWEAGYDGTRGRPPIHPRILAVLIVYGLNRRIRSSRQLEDACRHRIDFMWLTECRMIDHTTISVFRKAHGEELKSLFRQIAKIAMSLGMIRLLEVGIDGTRIRASNDRHGSATAAKLETQLAELDQLLEQMAATDELDEDAGNDDADQHLPPELATGAKRKERIEQALATVRDRDAGRRKRLGKSAKPVRVPTTDPDSSVLPNKDGGFAPNYTPVVMTDGHRGMLIDADVINDSAEASVAVPALNRVKEALGKHPDCVMMDGAYGTGSNLQAMESLGLDVLTPIGHPAKTNPALRDDPTQPVAQEQWEELPRNGQKKLDKVCFVYIESRDVYHCPTGRVLQYAKTKKIKREGGTADCRVYRCDDCAECPLSKSCLSKGSKGRTITRDQHEGLREKMAAKMRSDESRKRYAARMSIAETPFGHIKNVMDIRQFLLRGLGNVNTEWNWIAVAYNLGKVVRYVGQLRARFKAMAMA